MTKHNNIKYGDEIDRLRLSKAIRKVCFSEGITVAMLANDTGLNSELFYNKTFSEKSLDRVIAALGDTTKLGIQSAADIVRIADSFPDITHDAVKRALKDMAYSKGVSLQKLEHDYHEKFSPLTPNEKHSRLVEFESEYLKAKILGCSSLGDLLVKSEQLVDDRLLVEAVKTLRYERGISVKILAGKLGVNKDYFEQACNDRGHFSPLVKSRLPAAFGLGSLEDIAKEAAELETLPDRDIYGKSVRAMLSNRQSGMNIQKLADRIGCSVSTVSRIMDNCQERCVVSSALLRKIPAHFGCATMAEFVEKAQNLPAGIKRSYKKVEPTANCATLEADRKPVSTETMSSNNNPATTENNLGHWQHLFAPRSMQNPSESRNVDVSKPTQVWTR